LRHRPRDHAEVSDPPTDETFPGAPFRPYGLDDRWTGLRWIALQAGSEGGVDRLGLGHGMPIRPGEAELRVETQLPRQVFGADGTKWELLLAGRNQVEWLHQETGAVPDDIRRALAPHERPGDASKWESHWITVDGRPVHFQSLCAGHAAVAQAVVGVLVIIIQARRWSLDEIALVEIADLSEYRRGDDELRRRFDS
jgi:hypothetical protein